VRSLTHFFYLMGGDVLAECDVLGKDEFDADTLLLSSHAPTELNSTNCCLGVRLNVTVLPKPEL